MEQLKCLDQQCELRVQLLQDLQDFFRKKAEIEMDYSRNLEKLAERFLTKTRSTKDHLLKYVAVHHYTETQVTASCLLGIELYSSLLSLEFKIKITRSFLTF